jgi:beta-barrel assembly-enhancing protease
LAPKIKGLLWVLFAFGVAAGLARWLPSLVRYTPWWAERSLARLVGMGPSGIVCHGSDASTAALDTLVHRIYPLSADDRAVPITIEVIRASTVNAVATLAAKVYVFDGLIQQAKSPEELTGVLAHEIEHVRHRHIIQGLLVNLFAIGALKTTLPGDDQSARIAYSLLSMQFSRQQEAQADEKGLERLRLAQVDAGGFAQFFTRAKNLPSPPPFLSNHPSNESRQALAARFTGYPVTPVLDTPEWQALQAICR